MMLLSAPVNDHAITYLWSKRFSPARGWHWRHETCRTDRINHAYANGDESFEPLDDGEIDALIRDITEARA